MGLRSALRGKRVYVDTNIIIYLIEGHHEYEASLLELRDSLANQECTLVTSELTLCEALVLPFREDNSDLVATYRLFLETSGAFEALRPTSREVYVRASLYRAKFGLKTPDAIHVATAIEAKCDAFLTNDRPLKVPKTVEIIRIDSIR